MKNIFLNFGFLIEKALRIILDNKKVITRVYFENFFMCYTKIFKSPQSGESEIL